MISKDRQLDMLVGALEGGSNYWYLLGEYTLPESSKGKSGAERIFDFIQDGGEIQIFDIEDEDEAVGVLNKTNMGKATKTMIDDGAMWAVGQILKEEDDANTADVWFQYVVMGKHVFG